MRQVLEHWERNEWEGGRELYDDHCEVVFSTAWLPDPDTYAIGPEALRAWVRFLDSFEESTVGVDRIVDAGESVVVLSWIRARGRASGADVDAKVGCIFTVRDGRAVGVVLWTKSSGRRVPSAYPRKGDKSGPG